MVEGYRKIFRRVGTSSQIMSGMSYLGILSLIPLILSRDDAFVQFHARQGVLLWIWEVLAIYSLVLPGVGKIFFQTSSFLCFFLSVVGLASVMLGRAWRLPFVGNLAQRL
ncbi:MAG: hypothetical protein HQL53_04590 [Magnetococcales bacterium]|nr:hypothetical protein [Magnetococcales bacterium]